MESKNMINAKATCAINTIFEAKASRLLRHSDSGNSYVDKFGVDGGHKFSVRIEKKGHEQSRLVIHYGPHLAHVSPVAPICPQVHVTDCKKVIIQAADFAHWQERGVFKKYVIQFETNQEANNFMTCYKSSAPELHKDTEISESDVAAMGKHFENCVVLEEEEGECHSCWNQGAVGDLCDNCGDVMKWKTKDDYLSSPCSETGMLGNLKDKSTDEVINSEEDEDESDQEYVFSNTQDDWPVSPLMPFRK